MRARLSDLRGVPASPPDHPVTPLARRMRETFQDAPSREAYRMPADWPRRLHEIGQGRSVAYTSNKWQDHPRDFEDYKHVAESPNQVFVTPDLLREARRSRRDFRPNGGEFPEVEPDCEFPPVVSELAPFIFLEARPIVSWSDRGGERRVKLAKDAVQVAIPGAMLFGCYACRRGGSWSRRGDLTPFLAVIHPSLGVCAIVTGHRLDVKKDGIVG